MTSPASCTTSSDPTCAARSGTLVAMCSGGQWSACACSVAATTAGQSTAGGTATGAPAAVAACGNSKAEGDEQCDGTDLKGMTCATLGMGAATAMLKCNARCGFDTLFCSTTMPGTGGTGAGGSGARTTGTAGAGGSGR